MDIISTIHSIYSEYINNASKYVYYKEHDNIIILEIIDELNCLCNIEPKKYFSDNLKVVLIFLAKDPYKLVNQIGKYKINETTSSYCFRKIEYADNLYQEYYKDQKLVEINIMFGKHYGLCQRWYVSGQLLEQVGYTHGEKNGLFQEWYENGTLSAEGYYMSSKRIGLWNYFYMNGNKMGSGKYDNGLQTGTWQYWKETGELDKVLKYS